VPIDRRASSDDAAGKQPIGCHSFRDERSDRRRAAALFIRLREAADLA
jgi:hypothetical protein